GGRRRLHLQLVLRRREGHRVPALLQVPAARPGGRSVSSRLGHGAVGLAGIHPALRRALRREPARRLPDVLEQQAGAWLQIARPHHEPQAPAIMHAWWTRLAHAMFDADSGDAVDNLHLELDDGNRRGHVGSAFDDAFYSHVNKDARQVLGLAVADPWSRTYCGNGVLADCRDALWTAMSQAAADLQAEFGSPNVADWKRQVADESVHHQAVGVTGVP